MLRSTFLRCVPLVAAAGAFLGLRRVEPGPPYEPEGFTDLGSVDLWQPDPGEWVVQMRAYVDGAPWETVGHFSPPNGPWGTVSVDLSHLSLPNGTEVEIRVRNA